MRGCAGGATSSAAELEVLQWQWGPSRGGSGAGVDASAAEEGGAGVDASAEEVADLGVVL